MSITVTGRTLVGAEIIVGALSPDEVTVDELKAKFASEMQTDVLLVSLVFDGDLIKNESTLKDVGILEDCEVTVINEAPPELCNYEARLVHWADTNRISHHHTAIHIAAGLNDVEKLAAELDKGVSPGLTGPEDETPLHIAARLGCLDTAMLLIEQGSDVEAKNIYSNPILSYACFRHPTDENDHGSVQKDTTACMLNRSAMLILLILGGANVAAGGDGGCTSHERLGKRDTGATLVLNSAAAIYAKELGSPEQLSALFEEVPDLLTVRVSFMLLLGRAGGAGFDWAARMAAKRG